MAFIWDLGWAFSGYIGYMGLVAWRLLGFGFPVVF